MLFYHENLSYELKDWDDKSRLNFVIKDLKLKVNSQVQGEQLRVTAKKIDDLQTVITSLKGKNLNIPLQFVNMKS